MHYDELNGYIFVNGIEIYKIKAKNPEINASPLCLENIWKDFSVDNMKKTGLCEYVYKCLSDYNSIDVDNILDIHKYLI